MGKKKIVIDDRGASFDLDAVLCISSLLHDIREKIQIGVIEESEVKKAIPKSTVLKVIKSLGLSKFLKEDEDGDN